MNRFFVYHSAVRSVRFQSIVFRSDIQKLFLLPLFIASVIASEPGDLGVISQSRSIILSACTNRVDFSHYVVTVRQHSMMTNDLVFTNWSGVIEAEKELVTVPQGVGIMEVYSVCTDGERSPATTNRFDLQRNPPRAPRVRTYVKMSPPLPLVAMPWTNALPGGTNEDYAAHVKRMESGRRRSQ